MKKCSTPPIGPAAYWLILRCAEPCFRAWLTRQRGQSITTQAAAGQAVKAMLGVASRKAIDGNPALLQQFNTLIRHPYQKWYIARRSS